MSSKKARSRIFTPIASNSFKKEFPSLVRHNDPTVFVDDRERALLTPVLSSDEEKEQAQAASHQVLAPPIHVKLKKGGMKGVPKGKLPVKNCGKGKSRQPATAQQHSSNSSFREGNSKGGMTRTSTQFFKHENLNYLNKILQSQKSIAAILQFDKGIMCQREQDKIASARFIGPARMRMSTEKMKEDAEEIDADIDSDKSDVSPVASEVSSNDDLLSLRDDLRRCLRSDSPTAALPTTFDANTNVHISDSDSDRVVSPTHSSPLLSPICSSPIQSPVVSDLEMDVAVDSDSDRSTESAHSDHVEGACALSLGNLSDDDTSTDSRCCRHFDALVDLDRACGRTLPAGHFNLFTDLFGSCHLDLILPSELMTVTTLPYLWKPRNVIEQEIVGPVATAQDKFKASPVELLQFQQALHTKSDTSIESATDRFEPRPGKDFEYRNFYESSGTASSEAAAEKCTVFSAGSCPPDDYQMCNATIGTEFRVAKSPPLAQDELERYMRRQETETKSVASVSFDEN